MEWKKETSPIKFSFKWLEDDIPEIIETLVRIQSVETWGQKTYYLRFI